MVGWWSRAGTGFAIDPVNASHVLGIGGNGGAGFSSFNGMHVSWDMASSWNRTLPQNDPVVALDGPAVAFDPTSCSTGTCLRAYYSGGENLWVTEDGGLSWSSANVNMTNAIVQVTSNGTLLAASNDYRSYGVYRSDDGGKTFTRWAMYTLGLTVTPDDTVYVSNWIGVQQSKDLARTFNTIGQWGNQGLPTNTPLHHICVAPSNPSVMSLWYVVGPFWNVTKVYSHDGGATWSPSTFDNTFSFMPWSGRGGACAFHPHNESIMYDNGGDWPTRSDDGGKTLTWSGDGYNAVMVGGSFNFNYREPNVTFLAFQDYSGSVTLDGGYTWELVNVPGGQSYGYDYGGVALSASVMWAGDAPGWGGPRQLAVSSDGGKTFKKPLNATGGHYVYSGADVSYASPVDASVGFASNYRTADGGVTWTSMEGATSVHTHDFAPSAASSPRLFGIDAGAKTVVVSSDDGASWAPLFAWPDNGAAVNDIAYDWQGDAVYVANGGLWKCVHNVSSDSWPCSSQTAAIPHDQYNATRVTSVAVDPISPTIAYIGQKMDVYLAWNPIARSVDGGASWDNLLLDTPLGTEADSPLQGPHEVSWVRVHPLTRRVWAAGECYGFWTAPAPEGM